MRNPKGPSANLTDSALCDLRLLIRSRSLAVSCCRGRAVRLKVSFGLPRALSLAPELFLFVEGFSPVGRLMGAKEPAHLSTFSVEDEFDDEPADSVFVARRGRLGSVGVLVPLFCCLVVLTLPFCVLMRVGAGDFALGLERASKASKADICLAGALAGSC